MFKARLEAEGNKWTAELMTKLSELYPDGAPESDIETVFAAITQPKLKLVNGHAEQEQTDENTISTTG